MLSCVDVKPRQRRAASPDDSDEQSSSASGSSSPTSDDGEDDTLESDDRDLEDMAPQKLKAQLLNEVSIH